MPAHGKRRALGQHFLRDLGIINKISDKAAELTAEHDCKTVLEVGPGRGAITIPIVERLLKGPAQRLILAERDRELAANWRTYALADASKSKLSIDVKEGDFLDLPEAEWLPSQGEQLGVFSNLPYSAGTAIVIRLAEHFEQIPFMVLMFQAEVAFRLRAEQGTKAWGSLSIWIQNRWDVTKLVSAPPGAFTPPPDVNSEVVVLQRRAKPHIETEGNEEAWEQLLKTCFMHRRKMLRGGLPPGHYRNALVASGVDATKRAEALNWDEWKKFYEAVLKT